MTPEGRGGIEALKKLHFKYVTVPRKQAPSRLSERSKIVARERLWKTHLEDEAQPDMSYAPHRRAVEEMEEIIRQHTPRGEGGMTMREREIDHLYSESRKGLTFKDNFDVFAVNFKRDLEENREETMADSHQYIGYILDYLHLVDPDFVSFRDAVSVVAKCLKENNIGGYDLGVMTKRVALTREENISLRGVIDPVELRTDHNRIDHFIDAYLEVADDREAFAVGLHALQ